MNGVLSARARHVLLRLPSTFIIVAVPRIPERLLAVTQSRADGMCFRRGYRWDRGTPREVFISRGTSRGPGGTDADPLSTRYPLSTLRYHPDPPETLQVPPVPCTTLETR